MADGKNIIDNLKDEKTRMKDMTPKQRFVQFKTYYLKQTILIIIVIFAAVSMTKSFINSRKDLLIGGAAVNVSLSDELEEKLTDEYLTYRGYTESDERISLSDTVSIDFGSTTYDAANSSAYDSLYAQISAKDLDYLILDGDSYEYLKSEEMYCQLDQILDEEAYSLASDRIYEDQAIDITDIILVNSLANSETMENGTKIYLVFIANSTNLDEASEFVKYVLNM